jgi:hypothetical protein
MSEIAEAVWPSRLRLVGWDHAAMISVVVSAVLALAVASFHDQRQMRES